MGPIQHIAYRAQLTVSGVWDATRAFGLHFYETKGNMETVQFISRILFTDVPSS